MNLHNTNCIIYFYSTHLITPIYKPRHNNNLVHCLKIHCNITNTELSSFTWWLIDLARLSVWTLERGANDLHYGSADATATLLSPASLKSRLIFIPIWWRLKRGHYMGVCLIHYINAARDFWFGYLIAWAVTRKCHSLSTTYMATKSEIV